MEKKCEYGDWQTSSELSLSVCQFLKGEGVAPQVIIEPTCGKGSFILSALKTFDNVEEVWGIEIYKPYLTVLGESLRNEHRDSKTKINLINENVFNFDFSRLKASVKEKRILVLGNPPWVTNSKQGAAGGVNLPPKSNFKEEKGISAITGKGNFDIAEYISLQLIDFLHGENAVLALLLKSAVAKNLVYLQKNSPHNISRICQYDIDAKKEFDASVAMALVKLDFGKKATSKCEVFDFVSQKKIREYGWTAGNFVSDLCAYETVATLDGVSPFTWRSGIKHDCSKVAELVRSGKAYKNGLNEIVSIEPYAVYPLIKSSDINDGEITRSKRYVIVTQRNASDDTRELLDKAPKTYEYLIRHAEYFERRRSLIYKKRDRFCMFGIGDYSFMRHKVVVSGLYKHVKFALVNPIEDRPVMLDDTCYMLGFDNRYDAEIVQRVLNGRIVQSFIRAISFNDAKRVVNKELLMRIDFGKIVSLWDYKDLELGETEFERLSTLVRSSVHKSG